MNPTPVIRVKAAPGPAALMRLVTIILALMLVVLGVLAAQHAQTAQGGTGHTVLTELDTAHQPFAVGVGVGSTSSDIAGAYIAVGLATGCIGLIVCCALGLALLAARAWRADLFRRLSGATQLLRVIIVGATPGAVAGRDRPSLIVLSISRT